MQDNEIDPDGGIRTVERLCDCRAEVWWDDAAKEAFSNEGARHKVLEPLEATMRHYETTTLYYHAEEIDGRYVTYQTAEEGGCIYVAVMISAPIVIEGFDLDALLADGNGDFDDERTIH